MSAEKPRRMFKVETENGDGAPYAEKPHPFIRRVYTRRVLQLRETQVRSFARRAVT